MKTLVRRLVVCGLLLWSFAGQAMAQTDKPYVLKKRVNYRDYGSDYGAVHYLAHVKNSGGTWELQDATVFNPQTCIWYSGSTFNVSGTHHNYYFLDTLAGKYHFLTAPLQSNQPLGLSNDLPTSAQLKNPEDIYYFYDWDWDAKYETPSDGAGVSRGHDDNGRWTVYWVEFDTVQANRWHTSYADSYHMTYQSARFREVTINENPKNITSVTQSGLGDLTLNNASMTTVSLDYANPHASISPSATISNYSYQYVPAHTHYSFHERPLQTEIDSTLVTYHYYYPGGNNNTQAPTGTSGNETPQSYEWTLSGDAVQYLSLADGYAEDTLLGTIGSATSLNTTVYYRVENPTGNKSATLKLRVFYSDGSILEKTATIIANTSCQNPLQAVAPVVNNVDVTLSWYPTADSYRLYWKEQTATSWNDSIDLDNVTTYTLYDLEPNKKYDYKVRAFCGGQLLPNPTNPTGNFSTQTKSDLLVYGSVYGGGRMADVTGNTEIVVINCDSIGAIFGGNDIAGRVLGAEGSTITLGVHGSGLAHKTDTLIRVGSVYGGGNGYYSYDSTTFAPIPSTGTMALIQANSSVYALSPTNEWNLSVWDNPSANDSALYVPSIVKTTISVTDSVKIDTLFGGAKNAFLTLNEANQNGSSISINGGTLFAVFGGNNVGGSQGSAKHHIEVLKTDTMIATLTPGKVIGRDFGIGYLFGGGNKVEASTTDIIIRNGQLDTVFGGGNAASVTEAHLVVNCRTDSIITNARNSNGDINENYTWNGKGVYNVRTLFGGNNKAPMYGVPYITLSSGGVGTAYGGGNAGDMKAQATNNGSGTQLTINGNIVKYGTHMVLEDPTMYVDYLYGGCQVSNVDYSTWVEIKGGHVGTVYGGCNISGDVGSARVDPNAQPFNGPDDPNEDYQEVYGGTYVTASGGTIYNDLFAGSNGYYHCNNGTHYIDGLDFGDPEPYDPNHIYVGKPVPTHNETNVIVSSGATVYGNVYAGGNLACVGFTDYTVPEDHLSGDGSYPQFVGMATVIMNGGHVYGDVYGGGKMASVYGSNSVQVSSGIIGGALYGGNDRTGQVAQITNRKLPDTYGQASDGYTDLNKLGVRTYISLTGDPQVHTVYGGGNGDYNYTGEGPDAIQFCGLTPDEPIQSNTFVDVNTNDDARIGTVYGGGNGVTVIGGITVFLNVTDPSYSSDFNNVDTIFGGNNKGSLTLVPDIILLRGQVNTVYGGCNKGAMYGHFTFNTGGIDYHNVGSLVRLRDKYTPITEQNVVPDDIIPTARVKSSVYGGCRMNGVTNNSMVIVEGRNSDHITAEIYGGSDISGVVSGTSQVVVNGTRITDSVTNVYAGGNGNYEYVNEGTVHRVYVANHVNDPDYLVATDTAYIAPPSCVNSLIDMRGGTAANLYGGGYAADVTTNTEVNILGGAVSSGIYGGCYSKGDMGNIAINVLSDLGSNTASMTSGIFGGGFGAATTTHGNVTVTVDTLVINDAPIIYADIYGGSALGVVNDGCSDITKIDFKNGTLYGTLFGGGMGAVDGDSAVVNGKVEVNLMNGNVRNGVYGGCNKKGGVTCDIDVNILGGSVGAAELLAAGASKDVFGGGFGNLTATSGNVAVTLDTVVSTNVPIVYGDVYGGSGYGSVNTYNNGKTTTVTILNGTIDTARYGGVLYGGNVYGGGLGDKVSLGTGHYNYPARVYGKIYVNIGDTINDSDHLTGNATIKGAVYGCNNVYGSPQDDVFVNIFKTAHVRTPRSNFYPTAPAGGWNLAALYANESTQAYALSAVYGGGNRAEYIPQKINGVPRTTTVHVWGCEENTIYDVYGGGNAANVGDTTETGVTKPVNTCVIIDGGRIHRMFGGGNGAGNHENPNALDYNPGANIYGTASSYVRAGLIDEVYGGANQLGSIDVIDLHLSKDSGCDDEVFGSVFGCANEAPINHDISTTVECGVGEIGELYGGSNLAYIGDARNPHAVVTLTVKGGGPYQQVFGGSKGDRHDLGEGHHDVAAPIYGRVVLNLNGGTIVQAFGGSDQNGNVTGSITVNVDTIASTCPLVLDTLFGSGNVTAYTPLKVNNKLITSPIVNVKNGTVRQAVYGAGLGSTAIVTANPQVNIGDTLAAHAAYVAHVGGDSINHSTNSTVYFGGDVYGGGFQGAVHGSTEVNIMKANTLIVDEVFGGGDFANVDTATVVNVSNGFICEGIYGGCNNSGNVGGDIVVNVMNGRDGKLGYSSDSTIVVFGGGLGQATSTTGNVTVNFGDEDNAPELYGNIYGGSAEGSVNDTVTVTTPTNNHLTKVELKNGTVHGRVFGGGLGVLNGIPAYVKGNVQVNACGATVDTCIYGCNDQNGSPTGTVTVTVSAGDVAKVMGGGNYAHYTTANASSPDYPFVHITGGTVREKVVGGGNMANITGNPHIHIDGGSVITRDATGAGVYGGCNNEGVVNGNVCVKLTGGTLGSETVKANVFGGGYGQPTSVTGNVNIHYGDSTNTANLGLGQEFPKLYGDLYGGSALGSVNSNNSNTTTVTIYNGTIKSYHTQIDGRDTILMGAVYGGGLGSETVEAQVLGKVHVNIGVEETHRDNTVLKGLATLSECDVYGSNNVKGHPADTIFVDVYKTAHAEGDIVALDEFDENSPYGIHQVFGGGNLADYPGVIKRTNVFVHSCDNTVWRVFGGGNAADVPEVKLNIDGGRFDWVFGGGNGEVSAANIGDSVFIATGGGRMNYLVNGSNTHGTVGGAISATTYDSGCQDSEITNHFMGSNSDTLFVDVNEVIKCGTNMKYVNLYGGSNLAPIYGDVHLTIKGGVFENVYGGSRGSETYASNIYAVTQEMINDIPQLQQSDLGRGGNINLVFNGGTIGNIYGGCHINGDIDGKITITVIDTLPNCGLFIGNIYGAGQLTDYTPIDTIQCTPVIRVLKGTIGGINDDLPINNHNNPRHYEGNVFGGGERGDVTTNKAMVIIGDNSAGTTNRANVLGNVYGGGENADLTGNTQVILQGKTTIGETIINPDGTETLEGGNVFGGGKNGSVIGNTDVIIVPQPTVGGGGDPSNPQSGE